LSSYSLEVHLVHSYRESQYPSKRSLTGGEWKCVVKTLQTHGPLSFRDLVPLTGYDQRTARRALQSAMSRRAVVRERIEMPHRADRLPMVRSLYRAI
jgi:hypothetical protein